MSTRLEEAFQEVAKLPESDQESFAEFLLAELNDDHEWRFQQMRPVQITRQEERDRLKISSIEIGYWAEVSQTVVCVAAVSASPGKTGLQLVAHRLAPASHYKPVQVYICR